MNDKQLLQLRNRIAKKGLLYKFIADKLSINKSTLSHALNGTRKTNGYLEILSKVEKLLK